MNTGTRFDPYEHPRETKPPDQVTIGGSLLMIMSSTTERIAIDKFLEFSAKCEHPCGVEYSNSSGQAPSQRTLPPT